jgi:hypothetical protein
MTKRALRVLAVCGALACFAGAAHAADTLQRGVLLERDRGAVLLMRPTGGIEAVDILSGDTRWSNEDADLPVMVEGDRLLALHGPAKRGLLPVSVIALYDGGTLAQRFGPLPLPARALVDDRLGEQFRVAAADGGDVFDWRYRSEQITGALQLDQTPLLDAQDADKQGAEPLEVVELAGTVSVDWQTAALTAVARATPKALRAEPVELDARADGARRFTSGSGTHELASQRLDDGRYRWQVGKRDGALLGEIVSDYSYLAFEVHRHVLMFVAPLRVDRVNDDIVVSMPTLAAFDLRDGHRLWTREIRDTEFRGPFPQ